MRNGYHELRKLLFAYDNNNPLLEQYDELLYRLDMECILLSSGVVYSADKSI
ncbi:hypothetical protein [Mucilaginibacter pedocola]|nr:hypothetical protein [Mucilaginibacter pedocola]